VVGKVTSSPFSYCSRRSIIDGVLFETALMSVSPLALQWMIQDALTDIYRPAIKSR
jgi:hypothetical protein